MGAPQSIERDALGGGVLVEHVEPVIAFADEERRPHLPDEAERAVEAGPAPERRARWRLGDEEVSFGKERRRELGTGERRRRLLSRRGAGLGVEEGREELR